MLGFVEKQPADIDNWDVDFSRWITDGDTITTAIAAVTPAWDATTNPNGLKVNSVTVAPQTVKVWLSGGEDGKTYKVTTTATTAGGRLKETDFQMRVRDC